MATPKRKYTSTDRKVAPKAAPVVARAPEQWPFAKKNYIIGAVALVVMIIGFFLLGQGDTTASPILLVVAYLVLVPWAILARDKKKAAIEPEAGKETTV